MKIALQLVASLTLAFASLSAMAQGQPVFAVVTKTSVLPAKPSYMRGENIRIQVQASLIRLDPNGHGYNQTLVGPAPNALVYVTEMSTRGASRFAGGRTDRNGAYTTAYRVPTDPFKDNVSVCGWALDEEPFEGQQVRLKIGR